jgi:hypothetical protein
MHFCPGFKYRLLLNKEAFIIPQKTGIMNAVFLVPAHEKQGAITL